MFNFSQYQERRKFQPQEYIGYFEDCNLSLTQRLVKRGRFAKVSGVITDSFKWRVMYPNVARVEDGTDLRRQG